jgi:deazaflavin-dependent oxidoreductase (nitroreductase family)
MPVPEAVGRWNRAGLNRLTRHIAPWMPGLGVVVHRGRRSGRRYQTPVNVFRVGSGYLFALTYGSDTDWVKNVLAAGGCELRTRGRVVQLGSPRLFATRAALVSVPSSGRYCGSLASPTSCPVRSRPPARRPASPTQARAKIKNERVAVKAAVGLAAQPRSMQMLRLPSTEPPSGAAVGCCPHWCGSRADQDVMASRSPRAEGGRTARDRKEWV